MAAAIDCFAQKGFYGRTTHDIAEWVGISQPYRCRLYPNKRALFAAAIDHVSVVMTETLVAHSPASGGAGLASEAALDAARGAYAALVADRSILRFLMHANCAAGEPLVAQAVRRCYAKQVEPFGSSWATTTPCGAGSALECSTTWLPRWVWPTSMSRGRMSSPLDDPTGGNTPCRSALWSRRALSRRVGADKTSSAGRSVPVARAAPWAGPHPTGCPANRATCNAVVYR